MRRRDFFRSTIPVVLPSLIHGFSIRALAASPFLEAAGRSIGPGHVLVLIQLSGGNDGINTVIPLEFYDTYYAARTNIAIPQDKVLKLDGFDKTGLNPAMPEMQQLFQEGKLSII